MCVTHSVDSKHKCRVKILSVTQQCDSKRLQNFGGTLYQVRQTLATLRACSMTADKESDTQQGNSKRRQTPHAENKPQKKRSFPSPMSRHIISYRKGAMCIKKTLQDSDTEVTP